MKVLVDNVAVQAIEACLMTPLPDIISPASVMQMEDETIRRIAAESEEIQELRGRSFHFIPFLKVKSSSKVWCIHRKQTSIATILENKPADRTLITEQLTRKASVLKIGLDICKRYTGGRRSTTSLSLATFPAPAPRRQPQEAEPGKEPERKANAESKVK